MRLPRLPPEASRAFATLWVTLIGIACVWLVYRVESSRDLSTDRDIARAFQRCEQLRDLAMVQQIALDEAPWILARIRLRDPHLLATDGRVPVPDCARIYPRGAGLSVRFPELAPLQNETP
ncbi:MAG: hypothetical protein M0P31_16960 [Solirubrobacteraceae bacterium]|nr:hypothetical protein [Solirubrobacteraceae bacterium]